MVYFGDKLYHLLRRCLGGKGFIAATVLAKKSLQGGKAKAPGTPGYITNDRNPFCIETTLILDDTVANYKLNTIGKGSGSAKVLKTAEKLR